MIWKHLSDARFMAENVGFLANPYPEIASWVRQGNGDGFEVSPSPKPAGTDAWERPIPASHPARIVDGQACRMMNSALAVLDRQGRYFIARIMARSLANAMMEGFSSSGVLSRI